MEFPVTLPAAAYEYGERSDGERHGLVLTKPHIVELILNLAGYEAHKDLAEERLLEPACGHGAFLVPAVERLAKSAVDRGRPFGSLADSISAFDIDEDHVATTRSAVAEVLVRNGARPSVARELAEKWIRQGDFLLTSIDGQFDFIVGNPPYIRIEQLSALIQAEYRTRYETLFDRADLYVAFIERALRLLGPKGLLAYICADRWTLNRYGAPLRELITREFSVRAYVDLHGTSPFESDVIAYPSIFVIGREKLSEPTRLIALTNATPEECCAIPSHANGVSTTSPGVTTQLYREWFSGGEPWILSSPEQLAALRLLESRFPPLEADGKTFVRIGIATGNDKVFIVPSDADIEPDRLVPLVMRADIQNGRVTNSRRSVINTYAAKGIVDLHDYPRLSKYFSANEERIRARHIAQKCDFGWFRTIDRPYPEMVSRPKLLIPDIAGSNEVIFEEGRYYPHHNLYFVISDVWDLEVLGGLLSSRVSLFFVWSYAVKMRGGYLRFQAQYLRRIRVPRPDQIAPELSEKIKAAFRRREFAKLDELARVAYGLQRLPEFDFVDTRK